jgi:CheY-like chemotaxis protein
MDGIQTTKAIRELGIVVPIIAFTASIVMSAKETMLAAGMNDYMTKPIVKTELMRLLKKWIPPEKLLDLPSKTVVTREAEGHEEFWRKIEQIKDFSVSTGLESVGGQRDVYKKSLKLTILEIEKSNKNLATFLLVEDMHNFRIEVHGIKGSLASIGAMALSAEALELEIASEKMDVAFCVSNLPIFLEKLNELNLKLKEAFSVIRQWGGPIVIPPELPLIFEKMINAFPELDFVNIENEMENLDTLHLSDALKEEVDQIKDAVMVMDYDEATKKIRKLLR